jgi:hypothetical protein
MKIIEPTGVILEDVCSIQTEKCVAKVAAPITAVWTLPGRIQVNVCRPCLEEQIRSGEWEIHGVKIEKRADVAVYSAENKLRLVVEVKKKPVAQKISREWATSIHRNLLAHAGIPVTPFFLLVVPPEHLFLWKEGDAGNFERKPDYEVKAKEFFGRYFDKLSPVFKESSEHYYLEYLVSHWLKDLVKSEPSPDYPSSKWLYDSGLYDAIKNGKVVTQAKVAA